MHIPREQCAPHCWRQLFFAVLRALAVSYLVDVIARFQGSGYALDIVGTGSLYACPCKW
jgi:hypothetical protein